MADKPSVTGSLFKNPLIAITAIVLVLLVAGFAGNYYFVNHVTVRKADYVRHANQLKVLSQEIAKSAKGAAEANIQSFALLTRARNDFDTSLSRLREGNPGGVFPALPAGATAELDRIAGRWADVKQRVDLITGNQESLVYMRDLSADLEITMSAIQQENEKVVAELLRMGRPANELALAQRQSFLIERMSHSVDKVLQVGSVESLDANFARDSVSFNRVLKGLMNGDRELLLDAVNDSDVQASLTRISELFTTVSSNMNEILTRADDVADVNAAADEIYVASADFVSLADSLVGEYEQWSESSPASPILGLAFGGGAFLVLVIMAVLVHREANKTVRGSAVQNEKNQEAILQLLDELADLADGDLRVQASVNESFTGAIADSINFSIDQMRALVSKINETSAQVSTAANQTKASVSELSQASERQAREIADVSESVNEMAGSIDRVSFNAAESSSVAEKSVDIANKGASVVQNTIDGMDKIRGQIQETSKRIKRLGESSQEIGDIVSLINDIADQTNILSLNAAIQASMAGDAGKGFAVVADEVQRLAERSGAAAKQISALVKTIQSDTNEAVTSMEQTTTEVVQGTRLAQDAGVALGEIESVSKSLAEIIENISDAARQQAASAGKISGTMQSIQEITSQTTDGTRSTATAVGRLAEMTDELRSSVTGFKLPE